MNNIGLRSTILQYLICILYCGYHLKSCLFPSPCIPPVPSPTTPHNITANLLFQSTVTDLLSPFAVLIKYGEI